MKYQAQSVISGGWVDKSQLRNGQKAKIISECQPIPSNFADSKGNPQTQDVAKVHFEGQKEAVNTNLNRPTLNALIQAFGDDSKNWIGKYLTVEVEKVRVAGKAVTALYLLPEGYHKTDDESGYAVVVKKETPEISVIYEDSPTAIREEDLPF